jgi:double-stranded uracil-DNA glycosylase
MMFRVALREMHDDEFVKYRFKTLPDYLALGLDVVLIGINPGEYSVRQGHYFARTTSRFWRALSASKLGLRARAGLGVQLLRPEHDGALPQFGIGLTDVIKRPSANASDLALAEFEEWSPVLLKKIEKYAPLVACFHGLTAYRPFLKFGLKHANRLPALGEQEERIGSTRLYVVPNPSPANAHFTPSDQARWYDNLADFIMSVKGRP